MTERRYNHIRSDENLQKLYIMRKRGLSYATCARMLGCHVNTLAQWRRDDPKVQELLERGFAECSMDQAEILATNKDPALALKILERTDPDTFAPKQEIEIKQTICLDLPTLLSDDALRVNWDLLDEAKKAGAFRDVSAEELPEAVYEVEAGIRDATDEELDAIEGEAKD